ncbi:2-dehydropantoate 2-reductase (Ketopantoate reductase) (KPA reductase) (KPR) [Coemansia guatemalensis]|uniref:2-dehydropantoate 2-reductase (Ketopantoate reductase) (KPA reductase) (KPR) n=1 Tax=Coemansia guatemalensis TaxID=2761395 RepID=A0A9W8LU53_9FUNG|nr:2-dehydropantoate 2-reductase (Ketopantoate reductase) (KPA reductase) (KPR) [Coemansia guatemalensis]
MVADSTNSSSSDGHSSRIHVLGAGAVGLLFAAHLRRLGHPITLLLRSENLADKLARSGGKVTIINDWARLHSAHRQQIKPSEETNAHVVSGVEAEIAKSQGGHHTDGMISNLVLATKAQDTLRAYSTVHHRLDSRSAVVMLQNGMGTYEAIQRKFYQNPSQDTQMDVSKMPTFIIGTNSHGCLRRHGEDFVTHHTAMAACKFAVRPLSYDSICMPPAPAPEILVSLCALPLSGTVVSWPSLQLQLLLKLAANAIINPATALVNSRNECLVRSLTGASEQQSEDADFMVSVERYMSLACTEISSIYACGYPHLRDELKASAIEKYVMDIAHATSQNRSSMLQDVCAGRRTEVDWINGYLIRLGEQHGVPTPVNMLLQSLIKLKERAWTLKS